MNRIILTLFWLFILGGVVDYYVTANYVTKDDQISVSLIDLVPLVQKLSEKINPKNPDKAFMGDYVC